MTFELNDNQRKAVEYWDEKPLFIEAGPGSGKTRVLTERVRFLISEKNVDPESLLVITFTEKAADELKDRLSDYFPVADINKMQISTVHAYCYKLLSNRYPEYRVISEEEQFLFLSNHKIELGFYKEFFLPNSEIKALMKKYDEYSTFNVDTKALISYILSEHPYSQDYVDYVKQFSSFPRDTIKEDGFKDDWYNAKYLQIARSYPKYLKLLDENHYFDYNLLQIRALSYLNEKGDDKHRHILVDEFQDTDPIQAKIFEKLMVACDSFTAVGDNDQSIYGFRGANDDYFEYFNRKYDIEIISLVVNYRSTRNLVELCENFIRNQRKSYSKKDLICSRDIDIDNYYLTNLSKEDEARNLLEVIVNLKSQGAVEKYDDIAVLYRSLSSSSNSLKDLIELFKIYNIPYQIQGYNDILDDGDIKAIITLLYYLIHDEEENSHIMFGWQKDWLNLKAFAGDNFKTNLWNFTDHTKEYLRFLQDSFEENVLKAEKEVYFERTGKKSRIKKFSGVFNRDKEILDEVFERIRRPAIQLSQIKDRDDFIFFKKLNDLKFNINEDKQLSIFDIFYELLEMTGYYSRDVICSEKNQDRLKYMGFITNFIDIYECFDSKYNLKSFFWFMYHMIEDYSVENSNPMGVKIMTIHKSKGLESPVVIVPSFREGKFPSVTETLNPESGYKGGKPVYYTPNSCLRYKDCSMEEEVKRINQEELRVIYVAMTRAEDMLILSSIDSSPLSEFIESNGFENLNDRAVEDRCERSNVSDKNSISLSFTSFKLYQFCPCKYNLTYNLKFKTKPNMDVQMGTLIHSALENINIYMMNNSQEIDGDAILDIAERTYNTYNIELNEVEYEEYVENIQYYYDNFGSGIEVVDSERPFKIKKENYNLVGSADLIYKTESGKYGILDYKNTEYNPVNLESYKKQLYTYILALKEFDIDEAKIYAIKSRELIDIPIDERYLDSQLEDIEKVVGKIESSYYPPRESSYCTECEFSSICR